MLPIFFCLCQLRFFSQSVPGRGCKKSGERVRLLDLRSSTWQQESKRGFISAATIFLMCVRRARQIRLRTYTLKHTGVHAFCFVFFIDSLGSAQKSEFLKSSLRSRSTCCCAPLAPRGAPITKYMFMNMYLYAQHPTLYHKARRRNAARIIL